MTFDAAKWYWFVADAADPTHPYSSADANYVELTDAGYVAFLAEDNTATPIATEQELADYLNGRVYGGTPAGWTSTDPAKQARLDTQLAISDALWRLAFDLNNRVRVLEGDAAITEPEFFDYTVTLMK